MYLLRLMVIQRGWVVKHITQKVVMEGSQIQSNETIKTNEETERHTC